MINFFLFFLLITSHIILSITYHHWNPFRIRFIKHFPTTLIFQSCHIFNAACWLKNPCVDKWCLIWDSLVLIVKQLEHECVNLKKQICIIYGDCENRNKMVKKEKQNDREDLTFWKIKNNAHFLISILHTFYIYFKLSSNFITPTYNMC